MRKQSRYFSRWVMATMNKSRSKSGSQTGGNKADFVSTQRTIQSPSSRLTLTVF